METLEYETFRTNYSRLVSTVKSGLGEIARKAFEKNLITNQSLSNIENPMVDEDHRASRLLTHVLNKILEQETNFDVFVAVLEATPICQFKFCKRAEG